MSLESISLNTIDELYAFVENSVQRTALILDPDAQFRPWARAVSADCKDIHWLYIASPLPEQLAQHLGNFAHVPLPEKGFVLLESGRVQEVIDVNAVDGSSRPDRLGAVVRQAFAAKANSSRATRRGALGQAEAYQLLGADESDSEDEIKRKYKHIVMQYHPDRVAHLGPELRELASRKTTEINAAFATIRKLRGF
jgi:hypothetical protein